MNKSRKIFLLVLTACVLVFTPSATGYDCTDQTPVCTPNWSQLISIVSCDDSGPFKCCIKKMYHYTCYPGGPVRTIINAYEYDANVCRYTYDSEGKVIHADCLLQPET